MNNLISTELQDTTWSIIMTFQLPCQDIQCPVQDLHIQAAIEAKDDLKVRYPGTLLEVLVWTGLNWILGNNYILERRRDEDEIDIVMRELGHEIICFQWFLMEYWVDEVVNIEPFLVNLNDFLINYNIHI